MPNQYNIPEDINERFWQKVAITANPDLCWNWLFSCNEDGYGYLTYKQKFYRAHRMAWILTYGDIPKDLGVCHSCDNPSCCNPKHLFLGTHTDNMRDMVKKNRLQIPRLKGENHGESKLTQLQVNEIRQRYAQGGVLQKQLAKEYGIGNMQISRIIRYIQWRD